ncbi:MAG TPA: hypothetical protein VNA88_10630 [Candidatus Kapabacteria bacterium]|nr:hypothetical protein [Candidatus Kapabacteria bacterium]
MEITDVEELWQLNSEGRLLTADRYHCEIRRELDLIIRDRDGTTYVVKPEAFKRNLPLLHIARKAYASNGWGSPPF